jgi:hypothetical protein
MNDNQIVALMGKTRAALEEIEARLDASLTEIKIWAAQLETPLTPEQIREHKDNLIMAYSRLRVSQGEYERLIHFVRRAVNQRQSAKEAYNQGWDARLKDILAQLDAHEAADVEVRRVLLALDNGDTFPF